MSADKYTKLRELLISNRERINNYQNGIIEYHNELDNILREMSKDDKLRLDLINHIHEIEGVILQETETLQNMNGLLRRLGEENAN